MNIVSNIEKGKYKKKEKNILNKTRFIKIILFK